MNKVTTINLNGRSYQCEESGYELLKKYLEEAELKLFSNPDKEEIIKDLEQAIAGKCANYLNPHKNVILQTEIEKIIQEMGPVEDQDEKSEIKTDSKREQTQPRRLYKIKEDSIIFGVCAGIAAYFNIDVVLVRIICVMLGILSGGGVIVAYIVAALIIPYAHTPEEKASAHGIPFNAQELIDQAKKNYADMRSDRNWKKEWKESKKNWKEQRKQRYSHYNYNYDYRYVRRNSFWETIGSIVWLIIIIYVVRFAYYHIPQLHPLLESIRIAFIDQWYKFLTWIQTW